MVDFSLSDTERQIRDTVRSFITKEVMPLEPEVLRNERAPAAPAWSRGRSGSCSSRLASPVSGASTRPRRTAAWTSVR